jgi:hypothetical protein
MKQLIVKIEVDGLENWDLESPSNDLSNINSDITKMLFDAGFGNFNNIKVTSEIL